MVEPEWERSPFSRRILGATGSDWERLGAITILEENTGSDHHLPDNVMKRNMQRYNVATNERFYMASSSHVRSTIQLIPILILQEFVDLPDLSQGRFTANQEGFIDLGDEVRNIIGLRLPDLVTNPKRGDIVEFVEPNGELSSYGRHFIDGDARQGFTLIREDDDRNVNPLLGAIPSTFLVPSQFPPSYWVIEDSRGNVEPVPFDNSFDRRLQPHNFYLAVTNDGRQAIVLPMRGVNNDIYFLVDLTPVAPEETQDHVYRLIQRIHSGAINHVLPLSPTNDIMIHGVPSDVVMLVVY